MDLPTGNSPTTVVSLAVPAGSYVVLAKTQLSHTGAGDTVHCALKAGNATIDHVSMKTLPALAAIPMSLQAVTTMWLSAVGLQPEDNGFYDVTYPWLGFRIGVIGNLMVGAH